MQTFELHKTARYVIRKRSSLDRALIVDVFIFKQLGCLRILLLNSPGMRGLFIPSTEA